MNLGENINKPKWIKVKLPISKNYNKLQKIVNNYKLNTICQSANCPNIGECWNNKVATFMILGNICTRSCKFCAVKTGKPIGIDWEEPEKVAKSIKLLGIKHAVITSVDRDDLKDLGSFIWCETIKAIRRINFNTTLETLIPDFKGKEKIIDNIIKLKPEVISHNLETVRRLTKKIRVQAKYDISLKVLKYIKNKGLTRVKTGIMLGLGESEKEVKETIKDIKKTGADIITIGQYLQPTKNHFPVKSYISPEKFKEYKKYGLNMGFKYVESGPFVRSSYHADKHIK